MAASRLEVRQHDEQHRNGVEILGEAAGAGRRFGCQALRSRARLPFGVPIRQRGIGDQSGGGDSQVVVPGSQVHIPQPAPDVAVLYGHDPPRLPIAAAGGVAGDVQYMVHDLIRHRAGGEISHGPRGL